MRKKLQGIYQIRNIVTHKVYVGQVCLNKGHHRRWMEHRSELNAGYHYNDYLQKAWNKYGGENFVFEFLEEVIDETQLDAIEQKWIDSTWDHSYNIQAAAGGSVLGHRRILTEEAKQNIANANKSRPWTKADRERQSVALTGIKRDEKFKQRRREIMLGSKHTQETKDKISKVHKGKTVSQETRDKIRHIANSRAEEMSKRFKGKPRPPEVVEKIREAAKKRIYTPELRERMRQAQLPNAEARSKLLKGIPRPPEVVKKMLETRRLKKEVSKLMELLKEQNGK